MSEFVVPAPPEITVAVAGGGRFPVRRVFCVGRNYAAHVREMGGDPDRGAPFFFTKPADALVTGGRDMPYPPMTTDLHHEMELVVAVGVGGAEIAADRALEHVYGYAAGLDMTRRDLQAEAKKAGKPWDMAKGFDHSAPIGEVVPKAAAGPLADAAIRLTVNGEVRQQGSLGQMIWSVGEIVAALSRLVALVPGDLIFTGTPDGVAAVRRGDVLEGSIDGIGGVRTRII